MEAKLLGGEPSLSRGCLRTGTPKLVPIVCPRIVAPDDPGPSLLGAPGVASGSGGGRYPFSFDGTGTIVDSEIFGAAFPRLETAAHFGGGEVVLMPDDVLVSTEQAADWVCADERGVQPCGSGPRDQDVENARLSTPGIGQGRDMLDDLVSLFHRQLDDRRACEVSDDVHVPDVRLVMLFQDRATAGHVSRLKDRVEPPLDLS